jgi:nucleoid-associated protein YgaU
MAEGEAAPAEAEGDLQEIISEMNGQAAPAEMIAEIPAQENPAAAAPMEAMPMQQAAAPVETAPAPVAAAPAPAMGSEVGEGSAGQGLPEFGSKMPYIVQKGDTLGVIAQKIMGDQSRWSEIASLSGLSNPNRIYPGDVVYYQLTQQSVTFAKTYETIQRSEVTVAQGDTLASIAAKTLGTPKAWKFIWRQNDKIDNPDQLTVGTTIYFVNPMNLQSALDNNTNSDVAAKVVSKTVSQQAKVVKAQSNAVSVNAYAAIGA